MSDEEFYDLTPRQYSLLLKRHEEQQKHSELLMGVVASTIANFTANWSMSPPKQGMRTKPADFMPSEWLKRRVKRARRSKYDPAGFNASAKAFMAVIRAQGKVVPAEKTE